MDHNDFTPFFLLLEYVYTVNENFSFLFLLEIQNLNIIHTKHDIYVVMKI